MEPTQPGSSAPTRRHYVTPHGFSPGTQEPEIIQLVGKKRDGLKHECGHFWLPQTAPHSLYEERQLF